MIRDWSNFIAGRTALVTGVGRGSRAGDRDPDGARRRRAAGQRHPPRPGREGLPRDRRGGRRRHAGRRRRVRPRPGRADGRRDRARSTSSSTTRASRPRAFAIKSFVETGPGGVGPAHPAEPRRGPRRHARLPPGHARAAVGPHPHDRLGRRPQGRAQAGGLRRGEGRGDGLLARARGRGRPRRRDRQLHLARHDAPRAARRGDRRTTPSSSTRLAKAYPAGRIGEVDDSAPLAVLLCSDAGVLDHRPGVSGRRRLCPAL